MLYIAQSKVPNAVAFSKNKILVTQILLDILDDREVVAVLGHELGHCMHIDKHTLLPDHMGRVRGAIGGILGLAVSTQLPPKLSKKGFSPEEMDRRYLLKITATAGAAALGYKVGDIGGKRAGVTIKEDEADDEGVKLCQDSEALASALLKVQIWDQENGIKKQSDGYREFQERIDRLQR